MMSSSSVPKLRPSPAWGFSAATPMRGLGLPAPVIVSCVRRRLPRIRSMLSLSATFGAMVWIFQEGNLSGVLDFTATDGLAAAMPILMFCVAFGLSMDYEVFLVSSMREAHIHGQPARQSVVHGFDQASRVVVAAAIIMVAVFSGFIFSHDIMIKQIGFALAAGILIDAFIVRLTLVPALMAVFDERAWWLPRWLDRLLPDLDIEGDKLLTMLNQQAEAADHQNTEVRN